MLLCVYVLPIRAAYIPEALPKHHWKHWIYIPFQQQEKALLTGRNFEQNPKEPRTWNSEENPFPGSCCEDPAQWKLTDSCRCMEKYRGHPQIGSHKIYKVTVDLRSRVHFDKKMQIQLIEDTSTNQESALISICWLFQSKGWNACTFPNPVFSFSSIFFLFSSLFISFLMIWSWASHEPGKLFQECVSCVVSAMNH